MPHGSPQSRRDLIGRIQVRRDAVAVSAIDDFLALHPEMAARWGAWGREKSVQDAGHHLDFLAGAVEAGSTEAFHQYVRWVCRMLAPRGVPPAVVRESLDLLEKHLLPGLEEGERPLIAALFESGRRASEAPLERSLSEGAGSLTEEKDLFLQAALDGRRKDAVTIALDAVDRGHSVLDVYLEVLQETLYEVGRRWEADRITVADEHLATGITAAVAERLRERLPRTKGVQGKMVLAGVEGELHQVGVQMVADVLEADGWDVRSLGPGTPAVDILKAVAEHRPGVLGISCTLLSSIPKVLALLRAVRGRWGEAPPRVLLGGGAFTYAPGLCAELGASGPASDLRQAVTLARELSVGRLPAASP